MFCADNFPAPDLFLSVPDLQALSSRARARLGRPVCPDSGSGSRARLLPKVPISCQDKGRQDLQRPPLRKCQDKSACRPLRPLLSARFLYL